VGPLKVTATKGHIMKRNFVSEIEEIKSRAENNSRFVFISNLYEIGEAINAHIDYSRPSYKELLKYIPISTIACLEAFFRSIIKDLIDSGKPYCENVTEFNQSKNVKFDFDIVNAIQRKQVTIGEFISHILPLNSYEDINSCISTIIKDDFTNLLKTYKEGGFFNLDKETSNDFNNKADAIIRDIKRTFELRHIFCHEFATNIVVDKIEILRLYENAKIFIRQTDNVIWSLTNPYFPKTQAEMNNQASKTFKNVEIELANLISKIKEASKDDLSIPVNKRLFNKTIVAWKKYRKVKAEVDASYFDYGSMYTLMYDNSLTTTTREKIESLKNEYRKEFKKKASH
jgi:hypothetical protein